MLNAGRLFCMENMPQEYINKVLEGLASTYGLIGFMTAIPLNSNFMEYPHLFFERNNYFDVNFTDTTEYIGYFQPWGVKSGQPTMAGLPMPPTLLTGKTLEYEIVFSRNYAEPVNWSVTVLKELYTHFLACKAHGLVDNPVSKAGHDNVTCSFREYGLGFQMRMADKPTLVWDFNSPKTTIEAIYAISISDKDTNLKMCKNCGKAFYAQHGRSEFCEAKCRNQYNVKKFWEREKQAKEDSGEKFV